MTVSYIYILLWVFGVGTCIYCQLFIFISEFVNSIHFVFKRIKGSKMTGVTYFQEITCKVL